MRNVRLTQFQVMCRRLWLAAVLLGLASTTPGWAMHFNHNGDFDGDGLMDPTVYNEATGEWLTLMVSNDYEPFSIFWGGPGWTAIQSDYDGDGRADLVAYNRTSGEWDVLLSSINYTAAHITFGGTGWSAVTGDFDGDNKTDPTVYCEATGQWKALLSGSDYALISLTFGGPDYTSVSGDYDGDGLSDPGLYRRSDGLWQIKLSSRGYAVSNYFVNAMGDGPLVPIPADYDGDRKTDPALFAYECDKTIGKRYVFGWYLLYSSLNYQPLAPFYFLGREDCQPSDADPAQGDYDGDGEVDYAVTRPDSDVWRMWRSSRGHDKDHCVDSWHATGFRPVQR